MYFISYKISLTITKHDPFIVFV